MLFGYIYAPETSNGIDTKQIEAIQRYADRINGATAIPNAEAESAEAGKIEAQAAEPAEAGSSGTGDSGKAKAEVLRFETDFGKTAGRPARRRMLAHLREGDSVIVERLARVADSTDDLFAFARALRSMGIRFVSLEEGVDTGTPNGEFMLSVFDAMSKLGRCDASRQSAV